VPSEAAIAASRTLCCLRRVDGEAGDREAGLGLAEIANPGAGKTTVAAAIADAFEPSVNLRADDFFGYLRRGRLAPWTVEAHQQNVVVLSAIGAAAGRYARGGYAVVVDGIVGPWMLEVLLDAVGDAVPSYYTCLRPSLEVARRRATSRTDPPAFSELVPIEHMYRAFEDLGELERTVVDSSELTVDQTAEHILATLDTRRLPQ
jgi:predicted kinase